METRASRKTIYLKRGVLKFRLQGERNPGKGEIKPWQPLTPGPGDTVASPFEAYGTLDVPGTAATASVTSKDGAGTFDGTPIPSTSLPPGMDWGFIFDVPGGEYTMNEQENGHSYVVDPIHVIG